MDPSEAREPSPSALEVEIARTVPKLSAYRRELHEHPELAYQERGTQDRVLRWLGELGIRGERVGDSTAVSAWIAREARGPCVGLRADLDALPVHEATGAPFASRTEGRMHACGHDVHTAALLGAAGYLRQHERELAGPVKLLFQPAEEEGARGGALPMIEAGVLEGKPPVDVVLGLHVKSVLPAATFAFRGGPVMAAPDHFVLRVIGKGGHAAYPHKALDPVLMASEVVVGLQSLVSRRRDPLDPAVVSVSMIHGGTKDNILPDAVELEGTVRTVRPDTRDLMERLVRQRVEGIVASAGGRAEITYHRGYPVTSNPPDVSDHVEAAFRSAFPPGRVLHLEEPYMGGEDFAHFLQQRPGLYYFVGTDDGAAGGEAMHAPRFLPSERTLLAAAAAHVVATRAVQGRPATSWSPPPGPKP